VLLLWLLHIELIKQIEIVDLWLTLKMYSARSILDDACRHESVSEKQYEAFLFVLRKVYY
jgi:hypothetical protein